MKRDEFAKPLDPEARRNGDVGHDQSAALRFITCGSVDDG